MRLQMTTCLLLASVQRIDAFTASPYKGHHFGSRMHPRLIRRHNSADNTILTQMVEESIIETQKLHRFYEKAHYVAPVVWNSRTIAAEYLEATIDTVLFDCDGVLYRTMDACPGASKVIGRLISSGRKVLFVTNNAGVSRRQLREKLVNVLGIQSLSKEQMVSSSYSCTRYLMQKLKSGSRVHVIGSQGLCEELENSGFHVTGGPSNENNNASMDREELASYNFDEHPIDALAVGHDTQFTFRKLSIANNLLLRNPNSFFVATNHDSFDLVGPDGRHIPGNGCIVRALEYCSARTSINVGKPSKTLADLIAKDHNLDPSRCLFVGDRLDTDIRFANENGMKSLLVMTGVTAAEKLIGLGPGTEDEPLPHFVLPHVGLLL